MTMEPFDQARNLLEQAMEHAPDHIFLMLSGGNDSLTACHFAARFLGDKAFHVAHVNTGIGLPETRQFVYETCVRQDWPIKEYRAAHQGQRYEEIVLENGFPGPAQHLIMFSRLKERALRQLVREHEGKVLLISGARKQESARRMRLPDHPVHIDGRKIWCSPFFYMDHEQLTHYRESQNIPESPVRKFLCMSGECLCGAFAAPGELKEIETWFPATGKRIRELNARVTAAGFPWVWGERPPAWWQAQKENQKAGQADAFAAELKDAVQMMCTSCAARNERNE